MYLAPKDHNRAMHVLLSIHEIFCTFNYLCSVSVNIVFLTGINSSTHTKAWFQQQAVLRVSLGNFLFFAVLALIMIGVKDQNDKRDSWHHGGSVAKMVIWILLLILMFFLPNVVITVYG